jgi:hypothetical protein
MLTCREHVDQFNKTKVLPDPLWIHALDVLKHVLKGEVQDTFFKDNCPSSGFLDELRSHLDGKPKEVDSFLEAKHNAFIQERRWRRVDSEHGDLSVERFIDGEPRPCDDYRKKYVDKPAITIVMDMTVPYSEREGSSLSIRHKTIYKYACEANKQGRPCRVIAAECADLSEKERHKTFVVLKDYDDPIFPSIWAAFESNRLANSFINSYMDYFIGTTHSGNGTCRSLDLQEVRETLGNTILVKPTTWITDPKGEEAL